MLVMPQGYKSWSEYHDKYTPGRFDNRKLPHETGYAVDKNAVDNGTTGEQLRYELPNWFCVDCEKPVIPDNNQAFCVHGAADSYPGLDIKQGQFISYYICGPCIHDELWGPKRVWVPGNARKASRQKQREHVSITFLQSLPPEDRDYITVRHHATVRD